MSGHPEYVSGIPMTKPSKYLLQKVCIRNYCKVNCSACFSDPHTVASTSSSSHVTAPSRSVSGNGS